MNIGYVYWITVEIFRGIFRIAKKIQTNAIVPKKPLKINKGIFFPQGFMFLLFIIKDVINKLTNDLKNTNSYIGILLSIFFTHTVIRLKKNDENNKYTLLNDLLF